MATDDGRDPANYPGFTGETFPEVFTTPPPQPTVKKPGHLPYEKVQEYFENGMLVVEDVLTPEELEPVRASCKRLVDGLAQKLYKTGRVKNLYEDHGLEDRLFMLEKEWPGAVVVLGKLGNLTPEFQTLYQNEKLLDMMEQLVGPDIGANPAWNTRPKTPGLAETHVPWHQDSGYFDRDSYRTLIVTAWVPLVDATVYNGCLEFCKGGHKKGMVVVHEGCDNFYVTIPEIELVNRLGANPETDFIRCPVKAGDVVLFSNMIPHRSIPNQSDQIRWAMDLRYQNVNQPWGQYGVVDGILLRSPDKPDHVPDWNYFIGQDRHSKLDKVVQDSLGTEQDEFNTIITGPHMDAWKITTPTKHTEVHFAAKLKKEKADQNGQQ